jgi:hypothetical protein
MRVAGGAAHNHADAPPSLSQIHHSSSDHLQSNKKFKLSSPELYTHFSSSTIIIDGPLEGTKLANDTDYGFLEIGADVQRYLQEAVQDTDHLISIVAHSREHEDLSMMAAADNSTTSAIAVAAAIAAGTKVVTTTNPSSSSAAQAEEVEAIYQKAMSSARKSVFLLGQWKASWDSSVVLPSIEQQLLLSSSANNNGDALVIPLHDEASESANMDSALSIVKEEILPEAKAELETFAV